ncbi:hypothetical protein Aau02nite_76490 [Amorphoplanes auranticolor]|uniref:Uncharacterized protein n=1 Tax=Actinoplanes auranticolor TaxID=47988 RepID=A0A919STY7_9ACTN|nr:hypothetical protein Aau02nite_76490 [Actinoplanes auranticolor]
MAVAVTAEHHSRREVKGYGVGRGRSRRSGFGAARLAGPPRTLSTEARADRLGRYGVSAV